MKPLMKYVVLGSILVMMFFTRETLRRIRPFGRAKNAAGEVSQPLRSLLGSLRGG